MNKRLRLKDLMRWPAKTGYQLTTIIKYFKNEKD